MAPLFHYGRTGAQFGPFSATRMRELAAAGEILPADEVWQEGSERKHPASKVANLFAKLAPIVNLVPPVLLAARAEIAVEDSAELAPQADVDQISPIAAVEKAPAPKNRFTTPDVAKKKRIVSIRGGVLMGQDGVSAQFRKKCTTCGWEDSCRSNVVIRTGSNRISFYCRKCRKARSVEMQGIVA